MAGSFHTRSASRFGSHSMDVVVSVGLRLASEIQGVHRVKSGPMSLYCFQPWLAPKDV